MPHDSVKHLRLFGYRVEPDTATVRWLLSFAGKFDVVEHIDVDVGNAELLTDAFRNRNLFQNVPLLQIILDHTKPYPPGCTKPVSDLIPWKPDRPCTTTNQNGETIADPKDRVFELTEIGAICAFLCEHFDIKQMWDPQSTFQRCRSFELTALNELLARRVGSMIVLFILTKPYGTTQEEIASAITAHERELLWSFRQIEDILIGHEKAAAAASGLDYDRLLERGAAEVAAQEKEFTANGAKTPHFSRTEDDGISRGFTSPTLVALNAYIGGQAVSIADLTATSSLQVLPFLQAWLPGSLRQRNFPATLRYLDRMRNVNGFGSTLRPRLSFLKRFRRTPKIVSTDPVIEVHAARLRQIVESAKIHIAATPGTSASHRKNGSPDGPLHGFSPAARRKQQRHETAPTQRPNGPALASTEARAASSALRAPLPFDRPRIVEANHRPNAKAYNRADPRLLPQQHSRALPAAFSLNRNAHGTENNSDDDNGERGDLGGEGNTDRGDNGGEPPTRRTESSNDSTTSTNGKASKSKTTRGRPATSFCDWASRICTAPICTPCTLSEKDEEALRRSQRPRAITHSVDGRVLLVERDDRDDATTSAVKDAPTFAATSAPRAAGVSSMSVACRSACVPHTASDDVRHGQVFRAPQRPLRSRTGGPRRTLPHPSLEPEPSSWRHNPYDLSTSVEFSGPPRQGEPSKYLQEMADPMVAAPPTLESPPACGLYTRV